MLLYYFIKILNIKTILFNRIVYLWNVNSRQIFRYIDLKHVS